MKSKNFTILIFAGFCMLSFTIHKKPLNENKLATNAQLLDKVLNTKSMSSNSICQLNIDSIQKHLLAKVPKLDAKNKPIFKNSMSNMPIKKLDGEHNILRAVPDTTVNYYLLIKEKPN